MFTVFRMAGQDDVIPLSHPVVSITGEVISEIPVAKGQIIWSSLASYNRCVSTLTCLVAANVAD